MNSAEKEERTFTQEEVDRIIENRLARENEKRETEFLKRELQLDAREALAAAGLPSDLIDSINMTDRETMQKSIDAIKALKKPDRTAAEVATPPKTEPVKPDLRSAFGLSRKG